MKSEVRYLHIRNHNKEGQLLPRGGITVAVKKEGNEFKSYIAHCSDKDVFCKRIGRSVAAGRLEKTQQTYKEGALRSSLELAARYYNTEVGEAQITSFLTFDSNNKGK